MRTPALTAWLVAFASISLPRLAAPPQAAAQGPDGKLKLETWLDWERVSDPRLSPDGSQIVYTRSWVDKMHDSWESSIWIMNADGSKNRHLVDGSSPRWSPDGARIAYVASGEPEGRQIFVRWMDAEGSTTQITRLEHSPSGIEWSPDGKLISFSMMVESESPWRVKLPGRPEGAQWTGDPKVVDRVDYRQDRVGYVDQGYNHLFVVSADGGTPRQLTDGDWNHRGGTWAPDGSEIYFSTLREKDAVYQVGESEVYAVNVETGKIRQLTTRKGPDTGPVPSPDGKLIAYQGHDKTDDTYTEAKLYVMNRDGSNPRQIAEEKGRSFQNVTWAPDGSGVYFNASMTGTENVWFAPLNGQARAVTTSDHLVSFSTLDRSGRVMVGERVSYHEPGDVVSFAVRSPGQVRQLTHVNDDVLHGVKLGDVEQFWYNSVDDYRIEGWIIKPPDFDPSRKYPMMLVIHGGPHGMYNAGFNFGWQEHAANGYVVLYTNPRGSAGYGSAFGNSIKNAYPSKDFDDLMNGVDEVVSRGYVDENNMFVYGCSGGGVLTAWVVGHTHRFAAASSDCPVIDWISFVGVTDSPYWYYNFKHFPWEDPSEHLRRSPLMYVGNVTTPTMLMTGELDRRTPIPQTEEFYQALKMMKVPTVMVRFKGEWHGTSSKPSNFMRTQLYLRGWFEKHRRGSTVTDQGR